MIETHSTTSLLIIGGMWKPPPLRTQNHTFSAQEALLFPCPPFHSSFLSLSQPNHNMNKPRWSDYHHLPNARTMIDVVVFVYAYGTPFPHRLAEAMATAARSCGVRLLCAAVVCGCGVRLWCVAVVWLWCVAVVCGCWVRLWCVAVVWGVSFLLLVSSLLSCVAVVLAVVVLCGFCLFGVFVICCCCFCFFGVKVVVCGCDIV